MIEDDINRKIKNRLNKINYPNVVTAWIGKTEMEVCLNGGESFWFNPITKQIRLRDAYYFQGNIKGEQIATEFIDIESLSKLYLQITIPEKQVKEFEGIRLTEGKRITKDDREQITKYVAIIEKQNKSGG